MDRAVAYVLTRLASQPSRYGPPRPISAVDLAAFRLLVGIALSSTSSHAAPAGARPIQEGPSRPSFAYEETWNKLDLMMNQYEDQNLQNLALSHVPIEELYNTADKLQATNTPLPCYEDALAEALVKWFKPNFFKWIDPIKCGKCGKGTKLKEVQGPSTTEEKEGGAGRIEIHVCEDESCGTIDRFPRYGDLRALMKSRRGRCGEFANLFTLMIRAVGLRARYVWNAEDHVWNEYYSPAQDRWVHLDSCENARDQHHLYAKGWGKKMSYCIAFSVDGGPVDVSRVYIPSEEWQGTQRRDKDEVMRMRAKVGREEDGEQILERIRGRRRMGLSANELARLEREDERDRSWWKAPAAPEAEVLDARKSGPQDWKEARGEAGKGL